eukprot:CAMPEP_0174926824 /NCGR_PEP_ID=MMETSP1355-20121228/15297_1 /TAXON_ID=464990 /ORGANISM="Hemiselmis tepida, Strain CCMP443" /LENGTH=108 /DNA_ID=CAMNT_0016172889 /DNA_START=50 /DNA_END=376 /DNA_ORIENTATION=-
MVRVGLVRNLSNSLTAFLDESNSILPTPERECSVTTTGAPAATAGWPMGAGGATGTPRWGGLPAGMAAGAVPLCGAPHSLQNLNVALILALQLRQSSIPKALKSQQAS